MCSVLNALPAWPSDQTSAEVSGGYVFIQSVGSENHYTTGWLASGAWHPNNVVAVVGEVGGSYRTVVLFPEAGIPNLHASIYEFMAGPRVAVRHHPVVVPFAQFLFGIERSGNDYGGYQTAFSWQPGGGVDFGLSRSVAIRLQGDLRLTQPGGGTLKYLRMAGSVVFRK